MRDSIDSRSKICRLRQQVEFQSVKESEDRKQLLDANLVRNDNIDKKVGGLRIYPFYQSLFIEPNGTGTGPGEASRFQSLLLLTKGAASGSRFQSCETRFSSMGAGAARTAEKVARATMREAKRIVCMCCSV